MKPDLEAAAVRLKTMAKTRLSPEEQADLDKVIAALEASERQRAVLIRHAGGGKVDVVQSSNEPAPDVEAIVQKAANSLCGFESDADRRYWGSVQDDERHRKCCEVIRSAIARATAEGWISAKQSLPQDTRHVLVICEREHEDDPRRRWFTRMAWRLLNSDGSFRGWWQVVGGDEQFADKIVRYWRELPQMPAILTEGKR